MLAPKSYTTEDTVEINCHGGIVIVKEILELVIEHGARLAEPGEFTKRAFINGRMDLSQAEAVINIINSKTKLEQDIAMKQLKGQLSFEIEQLMSNLLDALAKVEAAIDYPDDYNTPNIDDELLNIGLRIDKLLATSYIGQVINKGITVAIIGKPNVGKSSLFNKLSATNSAIVTDIPGTTRDVLHEQINLDGIVLKLLDTAGIHNTNDYIEQLGIKRSMECVENADIVLLMFDATSQIDADDFKLLNSNPLRDKFVINVINKIDLGLCFEPAFENIKISVKNDIGLDELKRKMKSLMLTEDINEDSVIITNMRHKLALQAAAKSLSLAQETLANSMPLDLVSIDLRECYNHLGEITGKTVTDSLIEKIFKDFCVGK